MPRSRNLVLRLLAVVFGLVMAMLVAEVGLRVTGFPKPGLSSGRLETRHRSPPSKPDFRDRGNPLETVRAAGVRRVLVVGDSFTWGAGVLAQDAYPDRMQVVLERRDRATAAPGESREARRARRQRQAEESAEESAEAAALEAAAEVAEDGAVVDAVDPVVDQPAPDEPAPAAGSTEPSTRFEVVNFSRPGWNTPLEVGALRRAIDGLAPDVLVLGYCLNDSEPLKRRELAELRKGVFPGEPTSAPSRFLFARSALYRVVFQRADNFRMRQATTRYYHRLYESEQPSWIATQRALEEMKALADERNIPLLLVVFPIFDSQLDSRYHYLALHDTLAKTAGELGIDTVDLLPRYQGIDARRLAIDPFLDAHPSELAHRIAADVIVEELEKRGWLAPAVAPSE